MSKASGWENAQIWESKWWGTCQNTFNEEMKQLLYAQKMGLKGSPDAYSPYKFDAEDKSILDIGGGPVSLLLKCKNLKEGSAVLDPLEVPQWVHDRYEDAKIYHWQEPAETFNDNEELGKDLSYDEIWIYNVLQHTKDPQKIIKNARKWAKLIRIFEWVDTIENIGHPHILRAGKLNKWLGGKGKIENLKGQFGCTGKAYYGIFPTK